VAPSCTPLRASATLAEILLIMNAPEMLWWPYVFKA